MTALIEIRDLSLTLKVNRTERRILRSVSLEVAAGEAVGLVGESGSGKSMTARAVTGMLPKGAKTSGEIAFEGWAINSMRKHARAEHRGSAVSFIPQDPRAAINPVHTIGDFLTEPLRVVRGMSRDDAARLAVSSLADVGIQDGQRRLDQYPHELSGGLLQRVMICAALLSGSKLIVADEPTTALDVTTQSEVMALLSELQVSRQLALLFITHDLELAAAVCDRISVMYAGEIVETQSAEALEIAPLHPYTRGLLLARPSIDEAVHPLPSVPGKAIPAYDVGSGCGFASRCAFVQDRCRSEHPLLALEEGAHVRCFRAEEIRMLHLESHGEPYA
jgi:oligopeptide/dipeptide ABC transporter ATP-binding protein